MDPWLPIKVLRLKFRNDGRWEMVQEHDTCTLMVDKSKQWLSEMNTFRIWIRMNRYEYISEFSQKLKFHKYMMRFNMHKPVSWDVTWHISRRICASGTLGSYTTICALSSSKYFTTCIADVSLKSPTWPDNYWQELRSKLLYSIVYEESWHSTTKTDIYLVSAVFFLNAKPNTAIFLSVTVLNISDMILSAKRRLCQLLISTT